MPDSKTTPFHALSKLALRTAGCADILADTTHPHFPFVAFGILIGMVIVAALEIIYDA